MVEVNKPLLMRLFSIAELREDKLRAENKRLREENTRYECERNNALDEVERLRHVLDNVVAKLRGED